MCAEWMNQGVLAFPSAADLFRTFGERELQPLVDESRRARILDLVDGITAPVQTACYEARLSDSDRQVDLALCLFSGSGSFGFERAAFRGSDPADVGWQRVLAFLAEWSGRVGTLAARVPFVWIAFDLPTDQGELPTPCLGICSDRDFFRRRLGGSDAVNGREHSPDRICALADDSHRLLLDEALPVRTKQLLLQCLSGGIEAKHISFMLGRTPRTIKLDVRLPIDEVAGFLRKIGWSEVPEALQSRISSLMPGPGHVQLNLVLHPALRPPLEVEFLTTPGESDSEQRFAFLDRLVDEGLCGTAKARVLRSTWDRPLRPAGALGLPVASSWYVKVRFMNGRPSEAKAYLGLMPRIGRTMARSPNP
jgi:hypothetical protein